MDGAEPRRVLAGQVELQPGQPGQIAGDMREWLLGGGDVRIVVELLDHLDEW